MKTHDCGKYGRLTAPRIAEVAGVHHNTVLDRIRRGWTGEKLAAPAGKLGYKPRPRRNGGNDSKGPRRPSLVLALRLASEYCNTVPSVKEIQRLRPMSAAAAGRWRIAWAEALEDAA